MVLRKIWHNIWLLILCAASIGLILGYATWQLNTPEDVKLTAKPVEPDEFQLAVMALQDEDGIFRSTPHELKSGSSLYDALRDAEIAPNATLDMIRALKEVKDPRRLPAGLHFNVGWRDESYDHPVKVSFKFSPTEWIQLSLDQAEGWVVRKINVPVTLVDRTFVGRVDVSLWDSAVKAGMDPELISELAGVFAWQIDFNREVRPDDRWRIIVEQKFAGARPIGWGAIKVAEYENAGDSYTAIRFPQEGPDAEYYMPDGRSLKRLFLKSPIRLARVSSRFNKNRFHPVLKRRVPHNGVDYAARPGTPVMSVGKGKVVKAGRSGNSGIMVKIRHNSTYQTAYLHLKGIAKGVKRGKTVKQGQIIGYVGSTGLATGPHLHFSFYEGGRYVDPLGRKFPSKDPIPKGKMEEFTGVADLAVDRLPQWPSVAAANDQPAMSDSDSF